MSVSDTIFYSRQFEQRETVIRYEQEVYSCLARTFDATKVLISTLNQYLLRREIGQICIDESKPVKYNIDLLVQKLEELQRIIKPYDKLLAKKIEPSLYRDFKVTTTSFITKLKTLEIVGTVVAFLTGGSSGIAALTLLYRVKRLAAAASAVSAVGTMAGPAVAVTALVILITLIPGAIIGAIERNKLQRAREELEKTLKEFKPASDEFSKVFFYVSEKLRQRLSQDCQCKE